MPDRAALLSENLEKSVEIGTLCAFYGQLLTDRQLEAVELHYMEDLSLSEIAEMQNSTRQNIHETIIRSVQKLRDWEQKLGMVQKSVQITEQLKNIRSLISSKELEKAQNLLDKLINNQEGEDREHGI